MTDILSGAAAILLFPVASIVVVFVKTRQGPDETQTNAPV
jgi:hypothetical protein